MKQTFTEKCYKDSSGNVVLAQRPNTPIIVWAIATLFSKIIPEGNALVLLQLIAFGSIFTWAWMELFSGDTYIRRLLGLGILVVILLSRL